MSINVTRPASATENPVQAEFVKHSIQVYKDFIRPILPQCKVFHHTEENKVCDETGICILEIASPDKSKGVATIFTLANHEKNVINLRLKGANMGKTYKVTLDNSGASFTASGKELCSDGINIEIDHALSSELVLYECVSQD
jgi:alpha-galactosidase